MKTLIDGGEEADRCTPRCALLSRLLEIDGGSEGA
jgi:hypothetical protein